MTYYLLEQDLRIPDSAAVGSVPESIEPLDWMSGRIMPSPGLLLLPLSSTSGDFRGGIMGTLLTLFSDKLRAALSSFGVDNVDYFPVELEDTNLDMIEEGYWLANVIGLVSCVDESRSTIIPRPSGARGRLESFHVDEARAQGLPMFRLMEERILIVINHELRQYLLSLSLPGVRLRHTSAYDGY